MIRVAAALVAAALVLDLWLVIDTRARPAMVFSFLGAPMLGLGIVLYAWTLLRPVRMTADEKALYGLAFSDLRPRDFVRLAGLGTWHSAESGDVLVRMGDEVGAVLVLLSGSVVFEREGETIGAIGPGEMIGMATMLTGDVSWGNAKAKAPCRYLSLAIAEVQPWIEKNPDARIALQATVSRDLAEKLRRVVQDPT